MKRVQHFGLSYFKPIHKIRIVKKLVMLILISMKNFRITIVETVMEKVISTDNLF